MVYSSVYKVGNFSGSHNKSKVKCWLFLQYIDRTWTRGATIKEINFFTGIPIRTLDSSLNKWWSWQRIHKHLLKEPAPDGSNHLWSITAFGIKYLDAVPIDFHNECILEINEHQAARRTFLTRYAQVFKLNK